MIESTPFVSIGAGRDACRQASAVHGRLYSILLIAHVFVCTSRGRSCYIVIQVLQVRSPGPFISYCKSYVGRPDVYLEFEACASRVHLQHFSLDTLRFHSIILKNIKAHTQLVKVAIPTANLNFILIQLIYVLPIKNFLFIDHTVYKMRLRFQNKLKLQIPKKCFL